MPVTWVDQRLVVRPWRLLTRAWTMFLDDSRSARYEGDSQGTATAKSGSTFVRASLVLSWIFIAPGCRNWFPRKLNEISPGCGNM